MTTLNDEVRGVVDQFMDSGELFTALDVSNKVKLTLPFARHSEVRDVVRDLFTSTMQPQSWARSPISVTLSDGRQVEALLYHPLSDSWDLDVKYDDQKRAQGTFKPGTPQLTVVATQAPKSNLPITPALIAASAQVVAQANVTVNQSARDKWKSLFDSQPSLFPLK